MLRKITYTMLAFAAMLLVACTDDTASFPADGTESVVTFYPRFGNDTRTIGDATYVNSISAAVYEGNRFIYETAPVALETAKDKGIDITLIVGRSYRIVFWAQNSESSPYSFDRESIKVNVNYDNFVEGGFALMEKLDAFYAATEFGFDGGGMHGGNISLARPLAMLNFADNQTLPDKNTHKAVLTLSKVATSFSPFAQGEKGGDYVEKTFTFNDFTVETLSTGGATYNYVTCNYLFPTLSTIKATLSFQDKQGNELKATAVEVQGLTPNTRTNVLGVSTRTIIKN